MKRVVAALIVAGTLLLSAQTASHSPLLHATRQAPTDLEVGGAISGAGQFISYQDLLQLPQVSFMASNDSNFPAPARLGGVALDQLRRLLDAHGDMVVAICRDGYRSNYPASYLAAHHPVLVLTVNGKSQESWPKAENGGELGPYVVANPSFTPSFKVLSHNDEAQIPFQVVRLDFRNESEVFGPIAPRGNFASRLAGHGRLPDRTTELLSLPQHGRRGRPHGIACLARAGRDGHGKSGIFCQVRTQSAGPEPAQ